MKLGEFVVHMGTATFKFHQNRMKNKKVLLIASLMDDSSVKFLFGEMQVNLAASLNCKFSQILAHYVCNYYLQKTVWSNNAISD